MLFHVLGIGLFLVSLFWRRWCPWSLGVPVWNSRCRREVEAQDVNDCWTGCPPPPPPAKATSPAAAAAALGWALPHPLEVTHSQCPPVTLRCPFINKGDFYGSQNYRCVQAVQRGCLAHLVPTEPNVEFVGGGNTGAVCAGEGGHPSLGRREAAHPCSAGPRLPDQPLAAMCPGLPRDLHGSRAP